MAREKFAIFSQGKEEETKAKEKKKDQVKLLLLPDGALELHGREFIPVKLLHLVLRNECGHLGHYIFFYKQAIKTSG